MTRDHIPGSACWKCLRCKYFRIKMCYGLLEWWKPNCRMAFWVDHRERRSQYRRERRT